MNENKNKKIGNKNVLLFIAVLVVFVILSAVIFYGVFSMFVIPTADIRNSDVTESPDGPYINSNGDPIIAYDKTDDWANNVAYVAELLNTSISSADDIMHQVSAICEDHFSSKLYFFNRFEKTDIDGQYLIMSGDARYALYVNIVCQEDNTYKVTWVDEVDVNDILNRKEDD